MNRLTIPITLLLLATAAYVVLRLFGIQVASGEVYPEYSSLRSDPLGSKLLFDSLAAIPGVHVTRSYLPVQYLPSRDASVLFLALPLSKAAESLELLERTAARGNRVVAALKLDGETKLSDAKPLQDHWGLKIEADPAKDHVHHFFFADCARWKILDRAGAKPLAVERDFGRGTIVLFAESDDFNNQSIVAGDRFPQVSAALGHFPNIVFDEQHLGIDAGGSILAMARRFRLTGLLLGLLAVAALALWRNARGFPPPAAVHASTRLTGRTSHAGLLTLLRRHIPEPELAAACWQEWLIANRAQVSAGRLERAAEIVRDHSSQPVEAARQIAAVLHAKGEL